MRKEEKQELYRGFIIDMKRRDMCWKVTLRPTRPDLSTTRFLSFPTATQSEREALAQAKRRIDRCLTQAA
jgi:hypothetical protein